MSSSFSKHNLSKYTQSCVRGDRYLVSTIYVDVTKICRLLTVGYWYLRKHGGFPSNWSRLCRLCGRFGRRLRRRFRGRCAGVEEHRQRALIVASRLKAFVAVAVGIRLGSTYYSSRLTYFDWGIALAWTSPDVYRNRRAHLCNMMMTMKSNEWKG